MTSPAQLEFLTKARDAATAAAHVWPEYAACEAALESGWGLSHLAENGCNLFGMKQHAHPIYGTVSLPTKEFLGGKWVVVEASWVQYPDWASCFKDRMDTLTRLAPTYPHYQNALNATSGEQYVNEVSLTWSTDPERAQKVIATYNAHFPLGK